ncbi:alanine--tRNA ligase [Ornithobacterium rhinotracheale]|uniref:alanine--tRNA ligase n=1 Tax=Ornithobacterium rhinotracheale TaxID=28251 RepID=UPI00129CCAD1|nr:alanine--tRNA ligase [Ornithobacterium rhinotracheale]MRI64070.1 alanine--tRNA ligase [Ornithobacterium rhinotracheale]
MKSNEIRSKFLDFFASQKHEIVPSAPIVLKDDPTLMFTNAGMNQFKDFFLGHQQSKFPRIADTQKCLRVSGKHNDLDDVGKDTYHHTMFEMLGNWSFGDYFKKEAIAWAWELLTEVYKIDKNQIYVTIFEGDQEDGTPFDQEAYDCWKSHIAPDRILNGNKKDNFWEMGASGPCGPCSEIHVDIRPLEERQKVDGKTLVNKDHPQVIEVWNLVFMEFNRKADGKLEKLPAKNVDTGMGFERLCMILQGKTSNYDTDVFAGLIKQLEQISGVKYGQDEKTDIAIRVIVDHVRAVSFAIADGQLPSNNGAGYVIRRILRRAIRYGFTFLNLKTEFIYKLVDTLKSEMGEAFPELVKQYDVIKNVIKEEESSFLKTLDNGLLILDSMIASVKDNKLSGAKAFELYDTYGFPFDLTQLIVAEKGISVDEAEFEKELAKQKQRSKNAASLKTDDWVVLSDEEEQAFVGYDSTEVDVKIVKYRKVESNKKTFYQLVFNVTPFYAESGGQVGDKGMLEASNGERVYIIDTKKENNLSVHIVEELPSDVNAQFKAVVAKDLRQNTMANHSATHLLHQALRQILGTHVEQKGSKVDAKNLRFDFSHFKKLSPEEILEVEHFVNEKIKEKIVLQEFRSIPKEEALAKGAMALFGEKYGDKVRLIQFGESKELCGGTHVPNTADIWYFKIVNESAVAAGIRRIEAITGAEALDYFKTNEEELRQIQSQLNVNKEPLKAVVSLQTENEKLKAEIEQLKREQAKGVKQEWKNKVEAINGVNAIFARAEMDNASIKDLLFQLKSEIENAFIVVANLYEGKATISVGISDELAKEKGLHAGNLVREWAKEIHGGGGGQPTFATAGGKSPEGLDKVLVLAKEKIQNL